MTRVCDIQHELVHIGHPQNNTFIVYKILSCLPHRFTPLAHQISNERQISSLEELSALLQIEDTTYPYREQNSNKPSQCNFEMLSFGDIEHHKNVHTASPLATR